MNDNRIRLVITYGGHEPRIFDRVVAGDAADVHAAVDRAVRAFSGAFNVEMRRA